MASSSSFRRWATLICSIAFSIYFFIIIYQVPIFSVPCRFGICQTPLEVTSSQLIASEVFPLLIVKTLLYPGVLAEAICKQKTIPTYRNLLNFHQFNTRAVSAASGSGRKLLVCGTGLIKPGRMSLFGILLMGKSGFAHAKVIHIYPAIYIALISAFFSIRKDRTSER